MARALKSWNEATGALDRLDVDPLPHQISLVHRILTSGQLNWLIADDVGLGKTVEVGLLLAALQRRQALRRILIIVPSGLTKQWKEEMLLKFDRSFLIFGVDFRVSTPREWGIYEQVIVSLDYAKPRTPSDDGTDLETSFGMLLASGTWDIVVFDEAHRLSRDEAGRSTLRFRLAQKLRDKTDALLLLTGTPHQGDVGKFRNLLALVRPDLSNAIRNFDQEPEIVREIVIRNRKIDVVDVEGRFLFHGITVRRVEIARSDDLVALERQLSAYFRRGYHAGDQKGGSVGRAIGFVMTIYRKLASSSVAAIGVALGKRLDRLRKGDSASARQEIEIDEQFDDEENLSDIADSDDELGDRQTASSNSKFFDEEVSLLESLINRCVTGLRSDQKILELIGVIEEVVKNQNKKIVIFTEFRTTQDYLVRKIVEQFGIDVQTINGSKNVDEKRAAVNSFEQDADILISTEAGAEGLNLHKYCHILINYDLPWNPAGITQRIGRLYRYGQQQRVVVINFHARDTIDNEVVSSLLDRLDILVREMASVGPEFDERYAAEIMGELLERVDIASLLDEARNGQIERSQERIDAALDQARRAKELQDDILKSANAFDLVGWERLGRFESEHLAKFIIRASPFIGVRVEQQGTDVEKFDLRLPANLRGQFAEFGNRTVLSVTTRRGSWRVGGQIELLDFSSSFVRYLAHATTEGDFGGGYAAFRSDVIQLPFFAAFVARFQNDQGKSQEESLMVVSRDRVGSICVDSSEIQKLFVCPLESAVPLVNDVSSRQEEFKAVHAYAERAMAENTTRFRHPNDLVLIAIAERSDISEGRSSGELKP